MSGKKWRILVILMCSIVITACSKPIPPGEYDPSEIGKIKKVIPGVILSKRPVNIRSKTPENHLNLTKNDASEATMDDMENTVTRSHGFEYVIKLNSGAIISLVQTEEMHLKTKEHVLVIYGQNTRIVPDDGSEDN